MDILLCTYSEYDLHNIIKFNARGQIIVRSLCKELRRQTKDGISNL